MRQYIKKHQFRIGMALFVFGGFYQVINATNWGWWLIDLEPNYLAEGALFDGLTLPQVIARDYGFLAIALFIITLASFIIGLIMMWFSE